MSATSPLPGKKSYSCSARRFHFASECTTCAVLCTAGMSNATGRSTPFKSSFRPRAGSTNSGAVTRFRCSALHSFARKTCLISPMAFCVSYSPSVLSYPCGITVGIFSFPLFWGGALCRAALPRACTVWRCAQFPTLLIIKKSAARRKGAGVQRKRGTTRPP